VTVLASVRREPALWLFLTVVVVGLVQTVVFDEPGRTLDATVPALAAACVVLVGYRSEVAERAASARRWTLALAAMQVVVALWALQAFLRALPAAEGGPGGFYRVKVRVTTPLGDHNTVAGLLLVGVVATVVLAQEDRRWWAGVVVTTAGVVACLSRGAAVVLLAVALASWLVAARWRVAVGLTAAGVLAVGATVALAAMLGAEPPADAQVDGPIGASLIGRADLIVRGVETTVEHPLLGVGLGGFVEAAADLPYPNWHAHNTVANAGAEGGVLLALVASALIVLLLVRAWQQPTGWQREVTLLGGAALVAHGQVDVLGGLLGHEVLIAALLVLAGRGRATTGVRLAVPRNLTGTPP
jgi:O-antigen ligase